MGQGDRRLPEHYGQPAAPLVVNDLVISGSPAEMKVFEVSGCVQGVDGRRGVALLDCAAPAIRSEDVDWESDRVTDARPPG